MEEKYNLFTLRVIEIVKNIPSGETMSYGEVAKLAGNPKGARQVVRLLHTLSEKYNLPWHRVVNKNRTISLSGANGAHQKQLLESEGVFLKIAEKS